jgi:hypothetical protein
MYTGVVKQYIFDLVSRSFLLFLSLDVCLSPFVPSPNTYSPTKPSSNMDSAQQRRQALIDHKVITDVLPGAVTLSYSLTLKWPNATLSTPGQELDRDATQEEPKVYLDPVVRPTQNPSLEPLPQY